ncbi:MAG: succinylglutamate desuccinylase/aspartoacylase family protein, partial [Candidatus Poribacteria bacterium]
MKIGTCQAKKEHLSKGELVVAVDAQSNPIAIPILIATGSTDGKTIFLSAGVHGDEINSLEILQRFINNLDVTALAGTIIFLPLINVSGFKAKDRCVQYDGKDLNRCFPGDDKGTVSVRAKPLSPEQAIGHPQRKDFPIIKGKEVMIQAEFIRHFGQAFTDNPGDFQGSLQDVLNLSLDNNFHRAVFVSTLNAVTRYLGLSEGTQHCKDDAPERCAEELTD